jgi:hypothetical protein
MSLEYSTTIVWQCDGCKDEVGKRNVKTDERAEAPRPWFPVGWVECGQLHFCPKHRVKVVVDGKKVADWRATE